MTGHRGDEVLGQTNDARQARRLLACVRPYRWRVVLALLAMLTGAGAALGQPYVIKIAIDHQIAQGRLDALDGLAALYLLLLVVAFAAESVQISALQLTGQSIQSDLRMALYGRLQRLDLALYDRQPAGRLLTRLTSDVEGLNDLFTAGVVRLMGDAFTLVGIMIVMVWMHWPLALVTCSVLPLIAVITHWFRRHVRDAYRVGRGWAANIGAFLHECLIGLTTVQLFRREALERQRFEAINAAHRDAALAANFYYAVCYPAIEAVAALASALILWYGGVAVLGQTLSLGALVAFLHYALRFFRPISDMSEKFNILQSALASSERIFSVLDEPIAIASPLRPIARPAPARGHIVFDRLWFAYAAREGADRTGFVLQDVSFEVRPGERIGIVGATGSGKSTLIHLLLRFADPTRGHITIDGVDLRDLGLDDLRGIFALVPQEAQLFAGTIADNIRLGAPVREAQVRRAARAVRASRVIGRLPHGFATSVAECGSTMSVGEKQLLSFARALVFDRQVLILDEATSSVDTDTEAAIRGALRTLMSERTTIAIAHRLSTIQGMDRILVLHKGRLREAGTHRELLAARGIYYKLFELQQGHRALDRGQHAG